MDSGPHYGYQSDDPGLQCTGLVWLLLWRFSRASPVVLETMTGLRFRLKILEPIGCSFVSTVNQNFNCLDASTRQYPARVVNESVNYGCSMPPDWRKLSQDLNLINHA
jgi:hypothetical protein